MADSKNSGDLIHVEAYTRDDGTHVEDYYRHRSGSGSLTENTSSGNIDVPNTVSNVLSSFGDNKNFEQECPALKKLFGSAKIIDDTPTPKDIIEGGVQIYKIVLGKVEEVARIAIEIINEFAPLAIELYDKYNTYKGIYDKVSSFFPKEATQTQVVQLRTSIQGLRETQGLQQKNIDLLAKKTVMAKDQEEYSRLYNELAKQKSLYQKNETLLGKIEYSVEQQDYKSVMEGFESYMDNANQTIADSTSALKDFAEKSKFTEFDDSYFDQDSPYNFEDSHTSFDNAHKETYLTDELMNNLLGIQPAGAEEYVPQVQTNYDNVTPNNTPYSDNSEISALKGEVSMNVEKIGKLIKPIIRKAVNGPVLSMLDTKMGKIALDLINQILNQKAKDAADLMQISLYGPQNLEATTDYMPIDKELNAKLNESLAIAENDKETTIPKDWNGVIFDKNSHLAQSLNNSKELKEFFKTNFEVGDSKNLPITKMDYGFKFIFSTEDSNLFKSIHGGTIINPQDNGTYYTGILYDKYNFALELQEYAQRGASLITVINYLAYLLQGTNILNNYYLLVPIKIVK